MNTVSTKNRMSSSLLLEEIKTRLNAVIPLFERYRIETITLAIVTAVEGVFRCLGVAEGVYIHIVGGVIIGGVIAGPVRMIERK